MTGWDAGATTGRTEEVRGLLVLSELRIKEWPTIEDESAVVHACLARERLRHGREGIHHLAYGKGVADGRYCVDHFVGLRSKASLWPQSQDSKARGPPLGRLH